MEKPNGVNVVVVRSHIRFSAVLALAVALAGCGRSESYRYKLTLAVNTPAGVRRGSSVTEVTFSEVSIPARGIMHKLRGEALYLDLGPGARPLIALVGRKSRPSSGQWSRDGGPSTRQLFRLYDISPSTNVMDTLAEIARMRGPRTITANELPDLVTFASVNDPNTVTEVDPTDLQATLGPGIAWNEIILEITDEPVTKGIEQKLPWIPYYYCAMLDGARYTSKNTLANGLSTADFRQTEGVKKSIEQTPGADCLTLVKEWQQRSR